MNEYEKKCLTCKHNYKADGDTPSCNLMCANHDMYESKQDESEKRAARELLPCPFCGGEAVYITLPHKRYAGLRGLVFTIVCENCAAALPRVFEMELFLNRKGEIEEASRDMRERAAIMWNTRTENKQ